MILFVNVSLDNFVKSICDWVYYLIILISGETNGFFCRVALKGESAGRSAVGAAIPFSHPRLRLASSRGNFKDNKRGYASQTSNPEEMLSPLTSGRTPTPKSRPHPVGPTNNRLWALGCQWTVSDLSRIATPGESDWKRVRCSWHRWRGSTAPRAGVGPVACPKEPKKTEAKETDSS